MRYIFINYIIYTFLENINIKNLHCKSTFEIQNLYYR